MIYVVRGLDVAGHIVEQTYRDDGWHGNSAHVALGALQSMTVGEIRTGDGRRLCSWGINDVYDGMPERRRVVVWEDCEEAELLRAHTHRRGSDQRFARHVRSPATVP